MCQAEKLFRLYKKRHREFFDEKFLQRVNRQLEDICARYTRTYEGIDLGVIELPPASTLTTLNLPQQNELFATQPSRARDSRSARSARPHTALSVRVPPPGSSARQMSARNSRNSRANTGRSTTSFKRLLNPR